MKQEDFACSIKATVSPEEAMDKISRVSDWWAKNFTGSAGKLNDVFTVRFGETFVTFRITEWVPKQTIVWSVTDCLLPWLKDKTEWTGTKVIFELTADQGGTMIHFRHEGLLPRVECYDACVKGWTEYIPGSLLNLLREGKGQPS